MSDTAMKEKMEKLEDYILEHKEQKGALIPVLHETQELFGYIPEEAQKMISELLHIPAAEIFGVATFYSRFTLTPKGKHTISVCLGTACYVKNAKGVIEKLEQELNVKTGDTTEDGKFTFVATRCLGCCGLAPVMTIDEDVYGKLVPDDIPNILKKY
ncbi:MAG: NADH-quinone oxidoreductase subunit NuoE [Clostridiaceae bacterium]|nr:NADH-quinone oxidoreductase subunit NuoE [Clostridiaceae bacterium]